MDRQTGKVKNPRRRHGQKKRINKCGGNQFQKDYPFMQMKTEKLCFLRSHESESLALICKLTQYHNQEGIT